jgi:hypothetical protein
MKVEITEHVIKTVEITFPSYYADECHAYAIMNKDTCIQVCHGVYQWVSIGKSSVSVAFGSPKTKPTSKEHFESLYLRVQQKLDTMALSAMNILIEQ